LTLTISRPALVTGGAEEDLDVPSTQNLSVMCMQLPAALPSTR
jgi:hypothetical protein